MFPESSQLNLISTLLENFDMEDPLFLKQVILLNYYVANAPSEELPDDFLQQFDFLQKKCYNYLIQTEDSMSIKKDSLPKERFQCAAPSLQQPMGAQRKHNPSTIGLINDRTLDPLVEMLFYPVFRE